MAKIPDVVGATPIETTWGNAIRDRIIQRYASASELSSDNPTPSNGEIGFLEDSNTLILRSSGVWLELAPTPPGIIQMTATATAPSGWLLCNGAAVSRTTYAALFAAIGTTYGAGDGSTTFNLPDLRQRFPLGKAASGTGSSLGDTGGSINHVHTGPSHSHGAGSLSTNSTGAHSHGINHSHPIGGQTGAAGSHSHTFSDTFTTSGPSGSAQNSGASIATASNLSHTHSGSVSGTTSSGGSHSHSLPSSTGSSSAANSGSAGGHSHTVSGSTASGGTGNTGSANPPFLVLNFAIKF